MKIKIWDIVKLKESTSHPDYTYIVLEKYAEKEFESGSIKKEDKYLKMYTIHDESIMYVSQDAVIEIIK